MTSLRTFAGGGARIRALPALFAAGLVGCSADRLTTVSDDLAAPVAASPAPSFASGFAGGIPFGTFAQPNHEFGRYNGGLRVIWPKYLRNELAEIKARGGRVVLSLTGPEHFYKDRNGHFSLSRWKELVAQYRKVDFSSYIKDGTIIGHYLIDEPNDAHNWNGRPVSGAVVEEMAAYSKQLFPGMATIVRVDPSYLAQRNVRYRHLDAAWAQYVTRKGSARDYIRRNIADAKKLGLALLTGMNIKKGADGGRAMSAGLIQSAGRTILEESYPCAFISWQYDHKFLQRSDIRSAMASLASRARARPSKSCHRGGREIPPPRGGWDGGEDDDDDDDDEDRDNEEPPSRGADSRGIRLSHTSFLRNGRQFHRLTWTGAAGSTVDVYREGSFWERVRNDGQYVRAPQRRRSTTYHYKICQRGTRICSNTVTVAIRGASRR